MKGFLLSLIIVLSTSTVFSQQLEFGLQLGGSYYTGDMDAPELSTNLKNLRFGFALNASYILSPKLSFRGNLSFLKIVGNDSMSSQDWQKLRNLSFQNNVTELAGLVEYNLLSFSPDGRSGRSFTPYLVGGVAYYKHNPKALYQGQLIELQPLGTEGQGMPGFEEKYSLHQISIPFGGGLKIGLNNNLTLSLELLGRRTFTDHLDDLSKSYVNYSELEAGNGELSAILSDRTGEVTGIFDPERRLTGDQRGKASIKDYYFSGMVGINYRFEGGFGGSGDQLGCPTF